MDLLVVMQTAHKLSLLKTSSMVLEMGVGQNTTGVMSRDKMSHLQNVIRQIVTKIVTVKEKL